MSDRHPGKVLAPFLRQVRGGDQRLQAAVDGAEIGVYDRTVRHGQPGLRLLAAGHVVEGRVESRLLLQLPPLLVRVGMDPGRDNLVLVPLIEPTVELVTRTLLGGSLAGEVQPL